MSTLKINWSDTDGGAFQKVVNNMKAVMGNDEKSPIVATCSARPTSMRGYSTKKRVWWGAVNYNVMKEGRAEFLTLPDLLVGISEFCAKTFRFYGHKAFGCHLGIDPKIYYPKWEDRGGWVRFLTTSTDTTYGEAFMRKAWNKAVDKMDRVDLIIKDHSSSGLRGVDALPFKMPKSKISQPTGWALTEEQMTHFYNQGDVLIYMVPSLGSSLTMMESMACGVPPICPRYSAFPEFVDEDTGFLIDVKEKEAPIKGKYRKPPMWGEPDLDQVVKTILYCYENRKEVWEKGKNAAQKMRDKYTWAKVAENFSAIVEENLDKAC